MFIYFTDGSRKIFFQGQCWFLGIFPVCADFRTEHPARRPKRLHLVEMGRRAKRQAWKSFLKAKGNTEKGKEEKKSLNFGVISFATPCNLGKEVVACKRAQSLGVGRAAGVFLLAGHLLRASISDMPRLLLGSQEMAQPRGPPLSRLRCPCSAHYCGWIWGARGRSSTAWFRLFWGTRNLTAFGQRLRKWVTSCSHDPLPPHK